MNTTDVNLACLDILMKQELLSYESLTERALERWARQGVDALNQPAKDYCGVVEHAGRRYVHVGNSYHTFALYRVSGNRLLLMQSIPAWVTREVYGA